MRKYNNILTDKKDDFRSSFASTKFGQRKIKKALKELEKIKVRPIASSNEASGYWRPHFGWGWADDDTDGQNTRAEILIDHSLGDWDEAVVYNEDESRVISGLWLCAFTGKYYRDASELDIDHIVPLEEAWLSGAHKWSKKRSHAYGMGRGIISRKNSWLLPVSKSANRSKGSRTPEKWMPPDYDYWAQYCVLWIITKKHWKMSMTRKEKERLEAILMAHI